MNDILKSFLSNIALCYNVSPNHKGEHDAKSVRFNRKKIR
jgi:hypothetical protein